MRTTSLVLAAAAGIAAVTFAAPAGAFTPNSSAGMRPAAESIDPVASVHCRSFKHRSYNHPWGFGCRGGRVSVHEGVSIHERRGVRGGVSVHEHEGRGRMSVHERSTTRSQTNVRSRERTNVRGEANTGTSRSGTSERSSTTGKTGTTGKSSTSTGGGGTSRQSSGSKQ